MVRRTGIATIALMGGAIMVGCSSLPFTQGKCPEITDQSAWINRMPGPGQAGGKLHVVVRLADDLSWKLTPADSDEAGLLILNLEKGGPSVPGTAAYQQSRKPLPERIMIECQGKPLASIEEITVAY